MGELEINVFVPPPPPPTSEQSTKEKDLFPQKPGNLVFYDNSLLNLVSSLFTSK